jgi:hypothetical protein
VSRVLISDGTAQGATAASNLTFDGTALGVTGSFYLHTGSQTALGTGTTTITSVPSTPGSTVYFDYSVYSSGTQARRAGTVMAVWNSSAAAFTDTSTPDLVASTAGISFIVDVSSGQVRLRAVITLGPWDVYAGARVIF